MRIVKFKNGKYAIRKIDWMSLCYTYYDSRNNYWWSKNNECYHYCLGTKEEVEEVFNRLTDHGEEV